MKIKIKNYGGTEYKKYFGMVIKLNSHEGGYSYYDIDLFSHDDESDHNKTYISSIKHSTINFYKHFSVILIEINQNASDMTKKKVVAYRNAEIYITYDNHTIYGDKHDITQNQFDLDEVEPFVGNDDTSLHTSTHNHNEMGDSSFSQEPPVKKKKLATDAVASGEPNDEPSISSKIATTISSAEAVGSNPLIDGSNGVIEKISVLDMFKIQKIIDNLDENQLIELSAGTRTSNYNTYKTIIIKRDNKDFLKKHYDITLFNKNGEIETFVTDLIIKLSRDRQVVVINDNFERIKYIPITQSITNYRLKIRTLHSDQNLDEIKKHDVGSFIEPLEPGLSSDIISKTKKRVIYQEKLENLSPELKKWIETNVHFEEQYDILYTTNPSYNDMINEYNEVLLYNELLYKLKDGHTIVLLNKKLANINQHVDFSVSAKRTNPLIITITKNNESNYTLKLYKKYKVDVIQLLNTEEGEVKFFNRLVRKIRRLSVVQDKFAYVVENFYIIGELSNKIDIYLSSTKPDTSTAINDSRTPKVDFTMSELLNDQFKSNDYSYEYYDGIHFEDKLERLKKVLSKCKTNDLLIFIRREFIDDPNTQEINLRFKVGVILKDISSIKNGEGTFELKYIKHSQFASKFTIEDPHIYGKLHFYKHDKSDILLDVYLGGEKFRMIINSYILILKAP